MYTPAHFSITDQAALHRIMLEHPLGLLVTPTADGMDANHIPFEFDPTVGKLGLLNAHVARANPVWQQCRDGVDVMVIFEAKRVISRPTGTPASTKPTGRCQPGTMRWSMPMAD